VAPDVLENLPLGEAHPVFGLGKELLDRIEIGRVSRQEPEAGTDVADGLLDGRDL